MDLNLSISTPSRIYIKENGSCTLVLGSHIDYITPEGKEVFFGTLEDRLLLEPGNYIIRAEQRPCCSQELTVEELIEVVEVPSSDGNVNIGDISLTQGEDCDSPMNVSICPDGNEVTLPIELRNNINSIKNSSIDSLSRLTEVRDLQQAIKDSEVNYTGRVVHDTAGNHISNLVEITYQVFDIDGNKTSWERAIIDLDATGDGTSPVVYNLATGEYLDFITSDASSSGSEDEDDTHTQYIPVCVESERSIEFGIWSATLPISRPLTGGNRTSVLDAVDVSQSPINSGRPVGVQLDSGMNLPSLKTVIYQAIANIARDVDPSVAVEDIDFLEDAISISYNADGDIDVKISDDNLDILSNSLINDIINLLSFLVSVEDTYSDPSLNDFRNESIDLVGDEEIRQEKVISLGLKKIVTDYGNNTTTESLVDITDTSINLSGEIVECQSGSGSTTMHSSEMELLTSQILDKPNTNFQYTGRVVHDAEGNYNPNLAELTYASFNPDGDISKWNNVIVELSNVTGATSPIVYTLNSSEYLDFPQEYNTSINKICGDIVIPIDKDFFNNNTLVNVSSTVIKESGTNPEFTYTDITEVGEFANQYNNDTLSGLVIGTFINDSTGINDGYSVNSETHLNAFNETRITFLTPLDELSFFVKGLYLTQPDRPEDIDPKDEVEITVEYADGSYHDFDTGGYTEYGDVRYIGSNKFLATGDFTDLDANCVEVHPNLFNNKVKEITFKYRTVVAHKGATPINNEFNDSYSILITGINNSIVGAVQNSGHAVNKGVCEREVTVTDSKGDYVKTYYIKEDGSTSNETDIEENQGGF